MHADLLATLLLRTTAIASLFFATNLRADPLFEVVQHSFCRQVTNHEPVFEHDNPTMLQTKDHLFFWMEIKITRHGFRYLKAFKRLPILVAWGRDGKLIGKPIDIGITEDSWNQHRDAIAWKLNSSDDDRFSWRTHTNRPIPVPAGTYYVSIIDANRMSVSASGNPDEPARPELIVLSKH